MQPKVKVEILTNGETEVLKMVEKFNPEDIKISDSRLYGCDAPRIEITMLINPDLVPELIKELAIINETNYFTGISNYPDIRKYL